MKWFKHDTDANLDAKLQTVLLDYGLEGFGLYWYCLELIAGNVGAGNVTFALEHDARIIARNTGSSVQKIEQMMEQFVTLELFENNNGFITCYNLARRLDCSMTNSPRMRELIKKFRANAGRVMTSSDIVMIEENRKEENRTEQIRKEESRTAAPAAAYSQMFNPILNTPKIIDIQEYANGIGYAMTDETAQAFINNYSVTGWKWKGQPVEDWRPLVMKWKANRKYDVKEAVVDGAPVKPEGWD